MSEQLDSKILLMGKSGSGKTSMRSVIFADYAVGEAWKLSPTSSIEKSELRFINNTRLSLWDCSGRDDSMRSYVEEGAEEMFSQVFCLIYVFDCHKRISEVDYIHFESILEALKAWSPSARVYILLHKTDLIQSDKCHNLVRERRIEIEKKALPILVHTFTTSIWDETLFKAWSSIVHALLPNVKEIERKLTLIAEDLHADELVLFEPHTLLVLAQCLRHTHHLHDHHRFEKISSIVKQFRMSCLSKGLKPKRIQVRVDENLLVRIERVSEDLVVLLTGRAGHLREEMINKIMAESVKQLIC